MNFKKFMEMPLAHFSSEFGNDPRRFFNPRDRIIIRHAKTQRELERVLARSTEIPFNILMFEATTPLPNIKGAVKSSIKEKNNYIQQIQKYCLEEGVPTQGRITFAKNATSGGGMTAWMILHTLCHALAEDNNLSVKIIKILSEVHDQMGYGNRYGKRLDMLKNIAPLFKFKSAIALNNNRYPAQAKANLSDEFAYEVMTDYLWHGFIRLTDKNYYPFIKQIEQLIVAELNRHVGKIIVDYTSQTES